MKVDIEEIGPCKKQLKIEVPLELFTKEEEKAYHELGKKIKMPGFRKGKVPRSYLKKQYHNDVKNDVLNKIIPETYFKVIEEKGLKTVGSPRLENVTHEKDLPITFTATVDIIPNFEIKNYEGMEVTKKNIKVTDEDVEKELSYIRDRYATYEEVSDRSVIEGDLAIIDYKGFIDGKPFPGGESKNFPLVVGSNTLIKEFENGVIGLKKNEEKDILVTYPADYFNKDLANKNTVFKVKVNEIKLRKLPVINDQFIKKEMGKDKTVNELREEIREHQKKKEESTAESNLRADVIKKIIDMNPIEIPQTLIEDQINFMVEDFKQRMRLRGIKDEKIKIDREKFREDSIRVIKGELIQQKISEQEKIVVDDDKDIEDELETLARAKKMSKEKMKISMQKDGSYDNLLTACLRKKTMDHILPKLKINEVFVDITEFDK